MKKWIDTTELQTLNDTVKQRGHIDREDIITFLTLIQTTDAEVIRDELKQWMTDLHNDPTYENVVFPQGDIDRVLDDLNSYGYVQATTILEFEND